MYIVRCTAPDPVTCNYSRNVYDKDPICGGKRTLSICEYMEKGESCVFGFHYQLDPLPKEEEIDNMENQLPTGCPSKDAEQAAMKEAYNMQKGKTN